MYALVIFLTLVIVFLAFLIYMDYCKRASGPKSSSTIVLDEVIEKPRSCRPCADNQMPYVEEDYFKTYAPTYPWEEAIKADLEPETFENHSEFVDDITKYSSGASFTSVADDNNTWSSVNFVGLRRPYYVPVRESARSIPSEDETVLLRNREFVLS